MNACYSGQRNKPKDTEGTDLVTQLALDTRVLALDRARQRAGGGRGRVQEGDGGFVGVHVAAIDRGGGGGRGHLGQ